MASLTPGVLAKLLKHAGDERCRVVGEHRTPLLQVIEIVPALSNDEDPVWRTKGFYLKLSDSEHAAYAAIADEDVELIRGDKIKIGQFVYVSRLELGLGKQAVPVIRGIKAIPKVLACVGSPKDLISSDLLMQQQRGLRRRKGVGEVSWSPRGRRESLGVGKRLAVDGEVKARGECLGNGRRLSLDSARRGWDSPRLDNAARSSVSRRKSVIGSESPIARRPASGVVASSDKKREVAHLPAMAKSVVGSDKKLSRPVVSGVVNNSNFISPLQPKEKKLVADVKATVDSNTPGRVAKVSFGSLSDKKISWASLPLNIQELGEGVVSHRDVAILIAARALEETSAMERIVGCMSMFADLCESSENCSAGSVVETFLELHSSMERTASSIDILLGSKVSNTNSIPGVSDQISSDSYHNFVSKNAKAWIQAAVQTDLSRFCLYSKEDKKGTSNDKKSYHVVLEKTTKEAREICPLPSARVTSGSVSKSDGTGKANGVAQPLPKHLSAPRNVKTDEVHWSSQHGLKDAASLAHKLIFFSRQWFLKYLETSLKKGFGVQSKDKSIQILFGNLKRVNQWLEELVGSKHEIDERIEAVRKKLYNFLLDNVDSAARAIK